MGGPNYAARVPPGATRGRGEGPGAQLATVDIIADYRKSGRLLSYVRTIECLEK
jgi:hypothetical protein